MATAVSVLAPRPKGLRITAKKLGAVIATAKKYFGVLLTPEQARHVILHDETLMEELKGPVGRYSNTLDTYTRDFLSMALIEVILPGPPAVKDTFLTSSFWDEREVKYWHWPLNGSGDKYTDAFYAAFKKAAKEKGFKLARGFPG